MCFYFLKAHRYDVVRRIRFDSHWYRCNRIHYCKASSTLAQNHGQRAREKTAAWSRLARVRHQPRNSKANFLGHFYRLALVVKFKSVITLRRLQRRAEKDQTVVGEMM